MILSGVTTDVRDHAAIMGLEREYSVAFVEDASRGLDPDFVAHLWHAGGVRFTTADDVVGT